MPRNIGLSYNCNPISGPTNYIVPFMKGTEEYESEGIRLKWAEFNSALLYYYAAARCHPDRPTQLSKVCNSGIASRTESISAL